MLPRDLASRLFEDLRVLSCEEMEGRATGTAGAERARRYLEERFDQIGLEPLGDGWRLPFELGDVAGVNLAGLLPGREAGLGWLAVVAHYDHLGIVDGELHPGADDNASGVAALLAAAAVLARLEPRRGVLFLAPDGEERGQAGSAALVEDDALPLERLELVVNLDMLSRSASGELWAAGTSHFPELAGRLRKLARRAPVALRLGHDRPDPEGERPDWTEESDHAAFHRAGVPWLYFGVEDHDDYHTPGDTFERIDRDFYLGAVETVIGLLAELAEEG